MGQGTAFHGRRWFGFEEYSAARDAAFVSSSLATSRLQIENARLRNRLDQIEADNRTELALIVGDRIRILNPTCPGRNRAVIPSDGVATVTRISGDWVCFTCYSGVKTKRFPINVEKI